MKNLNNKNYFLITFQVKINIILKINSLTLKKTFNQKKENQALRRNKIQKMTLTLVLKI